jgi:choline transporter-like protein 2/4/5
MHWFNLFALYWGMCFASALGELILAGVFSTWYWTWDKSDVPCCVLAKWFGIAVFYHAGTVAFGSLILAIVRLVLLYFKHLLTTSTC